MYKLLNSYSEYKKIWTSLFFIVALGAVSNFIVASLALMIVVMVANNALKPELFFVLFLTTFFLADNFSGPFSYNQNLRFVILGGTLVYLYRFNVLNNRMAKLVLPFTIVALFISLFFSPLGVASVLRAVAFWLVALCIFGLVKVLYEKEKNISRLIVLTIALYFGLTLFLRFVPLFDVIHTDGRFQGMMGNPNGLGLLSMFSYGIIDLIKFKNDSGFNQKFINRLKLLIIIIIVFTGSRTALFSVLIYEVVTKMSKNILMMLLSLLVLGSAYFIMSSIGFNVILSSMGLSEFMRLDTLENASGRTDVWGVAWDEIMRSPFFGNGILYDSHFMLNYARKTFGDAWDRQWNGVWSSYLSLLLDVGFVGVFVYFLSVYKMFKKSKHGSFAIGFVCMSLFAGITESWMAASMNAFTPMFFLYWAIQAQPKQIANN